MGSSRRTAPGSHAPAARRRGGVLERAILDAALDQLGTVGWKRLTMEGVAHRAETGKAAVYRRWATKTELVVEALRSGIAPLDVAPDRGSLREDLIEFCRMLRGRMYSRSGQALRAVIDECDPDQATQFTEVIVGRVIEPGKKVIAELVRRGIERGDVRRDATGELLLDVLPALLMYRTKVAGSQLHDPDLAEIVDQVMVPLLRAPERAVS
jgi:AcrR family transcriptional regulator